MGTVAGKLPRSARATIANTNRRLQLADNRRKQRRYGVYDFHPPVRLRSHAETNSSARNAPNVFVHSGKPLKSQQMRPPSERTTNPRLALKSLRFFCGNCPATLQFWLLLGVLPP